MFAQAFALSSHPLCQSNASGNPRLQHASGKTREIAMLAYIQSQACDFKLTHPEKNLEVDLYAIFVSGVSGSGVFIEQSIWIWCIYKAYTAKGDR